MAELPRSKPSSVMATDQPSSTGPSTFVLGTRTSVKKTSPNSLAPLICRSGRAVTPSLVMSMSSMEMPRCLEPASGSVRTMAKIQSPCMALVVQTFWPFTTQESPSSTARVLMAARSEPAPGSEKPWHQMTSLCRSG